MQVDTKGTWDRFEFSDEPGQRRRGSAVACGVALAPASGCAAAAVHARPISAATCCPKARSNRFRSAHPGAGADRARHALDGRDRQRRGVLLHLATRAAADGVPADTRSADQRVIAVYFDKDRKVQRIADYGLKDGKMFDFISRTTPTGGEELSYLRGYLQIIAAIRLNRRISRHKKARGESAGLFLVAL